MNITLKEELRSKNQDELREITATLGFPAYRAGQLFVWLQKGAGFDEMSNIPGELKDKLRENYFIASCEIRRKQESADGTVKYLFSLHDGELIESVLMKYNHGNTLCISTQAGCKMGCVFCATGCEGFRRNLSAGELLTQITAAEKESAEKISNIVLMGMGEPLDNYTETLRFLELISQSEGLNIGARHITVSTCGIVPKIRELQKLSPQFTLSVSLHAPNDEIRGRLMPVNKKWGTDELISACRDYAEYTKRRVSFEYSLIDGVNDTPECARELVRKLRGILCHVNLIPVNQTGIEGISGSKSEKVKEFHDILRKSGITATVRRTLGADIDASCGQLRGKDIKDVMI